MRMKITSTGRAGPGVLQEYGEQLKNFKLSHTNGVATFNDEGTICCGVCGCECNNSEAALWHCDFSTIEINTPEELVELSKAVGSEIVLRKDGTLEIYDDYRE